MAEFNTDYLRWDSDSVKRLIIQKLSENENFTDQVFEDSNLATLIDVFSYMYDALSYYLNHGASEAMFSDATLYENINRIVKMLGYNPSGFTSSIIESIFVSSDTLSFTQAVLPKYTRVDTGLVDTNGNQIFYSMTTNRFITTDSNNELPETTTDKTVFTNGRWKLYETTFTSTGQAFEDFVLSDIVLNDSDNPRFISHPYIDVYIKRANTETNDFDYIAYNAVSQGTLFGDGTSIVGPNDDVFELRLNENYNYSITFGDGVHGSRLIEGDEIYVVYLEGNGPDASIGANVLGLNNELSIGIAGMSSDLFSKIVSIDNLIPDADLENMFTRNITASTTFAGLETVDEIRNEAPIWFRMGDRLITAKDFEEYISNQFKGDIEDVKVMNNWKYLSDFMQWLDQYNSLVVDIREREYPYADSCDFNNVYLWIKFKSSPISSSIITNDLTNKKCLTAEPVVVEALNTQFIPCLKNNSYDINNWDPNVENYIEVIKDPNSFISVEKVQQQCESTIRNFFDQSSLSLGQNMDFRNLYNQLLAIDGVRTVRTAYKPNGNCSQIQYFDGLSFAFWTTKLISGQDLTIANGNVSMRNFQFPILIDDQFLKLDQRLKVVFEAFGSPSVEY